VHAPGAAGAVPVLSGNVQLQLGGVLRQQLDQVGEGLEVLVGCSLVVIGPRRSSAPHRVRGHQPGVAHRRTIEWTKTLGRKTLHPRPLRWWDPCGLSISVPRQGPGTGSRRGIQCVTAGSGRWASRTSINRAMLPVAVTPLSRNPPSQAGEC